MGILPGGTGNGFANEMGTPKKLEPAVELLCTSQKVRRVDVVQIGEGYFIQRLYVGIEPEEQTSREDKDRYGTFAYAINMYRQGKMYKEREVEYEIKLDGKQLRVAGMKLYVVNAAQSGTGISVTGGLSIPDDGLADVFVLDLKNLKTLAAAADRVLHLNTEHSNAYYWRASEVTVDTDPDQPVWTDGEYWGRTPVSLKVLPGVLPVVVP
jgi:diacylglycerol kinase family enzyme